MDAPLRLSMFRRLLSEYCHRTRFESNLISGKRLLRCHQKLCRSNHIFKYVTTITNDAVHYKNPVKASQDVGLQSGLKLAFRCHENDPVHHSIDQEGLFYTVSEAEYKKLLQKALPRAFQTQSKIFTETSIMVRQPALEMIEYIKNANLNRPVVRAVFYGHSGVGKTMSLCHVLHYCANNNWLLVHVPWPALWNKRRREKSVSSFKPGRVDLPVDAAAWLLHFRTQNAELLQDLMCEHTYTWSKREVTEAGSPLIDIVDFGLNRTKFASDCIGALLKEVKQLASGKKVKVLVAVDGVNALFTKSQLRTDEREDVLVENVSLVRSFRKMLQTNWTNGFVACTVDKNANHYENRDNYTPSYLLGKTGFEALDPFIPVLVSQYSEKEIYSCLRYYADRNWIQHPKGLTDEGLKEIIFLSNHNPHTLSRICASR